MNILLELALILIFAKLVSEILLRVKLSPVLGEILLGVFMGSSFLGLISESVFWTILSEISVIIMIFVVGLEIKIEHLRRVGKTASFVAFGGVFIPLVSGFGMGLLFDYGWRMSLFIGGIITATSIAVTARVFMDLRQVRSRLSQTILTSAILDDIMGEPISVSPDDDLEDALKIAVQHDLQDMPVTKNGKVVGDLNCFEILDNLNLG